MDISQQIVNISKAGAYDALVPYVGELKDVIRKLIEVGELDELTFTDPADTEEFQNLVKKAKILSL